MTNLQINKWIKCLKLVKVNCHRGLISYYLVALLWELLWSGWDERKPNQEKNQNRTIYCWEIETLYTQEADQELIGPLRGGSTEIGTDASI